MEQRIQQFRISSIFLILTALFYIPILAKIDNFAKIT